MCSFQKVCRLSKIYDAKKIRFFKFIKKFYLKLFFYVFKEPISKLMLKQSTNYPTYVSIRSLSTCILYTFLLLLFSFQTLFLRIILVNESTKLCLWASIKVSNKYLLWGWWWTILKNKMDHYLKKEEKMLKKIFLDEYFLWKFGENHSSFCCWMK